MGPAVEIAEVAAEPAGSLGLALDAPRPGQVVPGYLFPVRGSVVVHPGAPAIGHFSVAGGGRVSRGLAQAGDDASCSFSFLVGCAAQPREFDVELDASLEDGTRTRLAAIRGRRSQLESSFEPTVAPLLVTTLGRSGSSVLVEALEGHPEIAAYHPFAADPRPAAYWSSVFRELSDPDSSVRQLAHGRLPDRAERGWWLGGRVPQESFEDDPLERWIGADHVISLAGYCQSRIESLYAKIGAEAGLAPRFFAEKARPDAVSDTLRELYPRSGEVILVRDWRDVFCSMRSYSAKRGVQLFGREHGGDEEHLRALRAAIEELMRHRDAHRDRCHTVRYEDLVLDPGPTIAGILEYLGLERGPETLAAMCGPVHDSGPEGDAHRTTASGARSIGRWRDELGAELRSRCGEELGPLLAQLGYEPE